ncbi:hypothetical protein TrVE_jg3188 [Triparma verrucosa]|uniref:Uncharacterized protein n=1 Tax=Triparma verrucosa TaxID=1606542 RepID=A0A9W7F186_9STRA|nr:hypothetical protein TrVE_jg3188 [Triparma verrucosa]
MDSMADFAPSLGEDLEESPSRSFRKYKMNPCFPPIHSNPTLPPPSPSSSTFEGFVDPSTGELLEGTITWSNLDTFEGKFTQNSPSTGVFTSPTASLKYIGPILSSSFSGSGTLIISSISTYKGTFLSGKKSGSGQIFLQNGSSYDCCWKNDMKEGLGKHYNSSGDKIYVGTYEKDQRKTGCFYFTEGWYQGDFLENKYHGRGHYHTDVIDYEGGFVNGLRSGFGKLTNFVTNVTKEGVFENGNETDGEWLIIYSDSSKFSGLCSQGVPSGLGILKYGNGDTYSGNFYEGLRSGPGLLVFESGGEYEGEFIQDEPVGLQFFTSSSPTKSTLKKYSNSPTEITLSEINLTDSSPPSPPPPPSTSNLSTSKRIIENLPKHIYPDSSIYYGNLTASLEREGFGVYISTHPPFRYEGSFKANKRHGHGQFTTSHLSFIGVYSEDVMLKGLYTVNSTFSYEGSFKGGLFDGEGKYVDLNNNVYVGHFVNGVKNGRGVMKYNDNVSEYDGCWVNNKRTGHGTFKGKNQEYKGEWKDDYQHGYGKMTTESEEYEGEFEGGKYAGFGKLTRQDCTVEGSFKNGNLSSKSAQLTTRDYTYSGTVENVIPHGEGVIKYSNGDVYTGSFIQGLRSGYGKCVYINGDCFEGEWKDDDIVKGNMVMEDGSVMKLIE